MATDLTAIDRNTCARTNCPSGFVRNQLNLRDKLLCDLVADIRSAPQPLLTRDPMGFAVHRYPRCESDCIFAHNRALRGTASRGLGEYHGGK